MTRYAWFAACVMSALAVGCSSSSSYRVTDLRCEYRKDPLGVDVARPRLSWAIEAPAGARDVKQAAYQVLVASSPMKLAAGEGDLWDSGKVASDQSVQVEYAGRALTSGQRCWWTVRAWINSGQASAPAVVESDRGMWSMGLLKAEDWKGKWIGRDEAEPGKMPSVLAGAKWIWYPEGEPEKSAPIGVRFFRRTIAIPQGVAKATCWITGDNQFTLFINGKKIGGGSNFKQASEFDIADNLVAGANTIAVSVDNSGNAANPAGMIARVVIQPKAGPEVIVVSDGQWKSSQSAGGGWEGTGFNDSQWSAAKELGPVGMAPWGEVGRPEFTRLAARMLRREFEVKKPVKDATAYICGLGMSELYLNGKKIGDDVLSPGLSEYEKRALYVTHDVTEQIKGGKNAIGVILGNGRYFAPRHDVPIGTKTFGYPKLMLQLQINYVDGTSDTIVSDESWKLTTDGPIRANNEYDGEEYDARKEMPGWCEAGFDDSNWQKAQVVKGIDGVLSSQMAEPMKVVETIKPIAISSPKAGMYILDMGQNMVGWVRIKVSGPAGTVVMLRHAETLKPDGTLYLDNIRSAKVTDTYTLKGKGTEIYEPRFTFHGFRYVEVRGWPGAPKLEDFEGRVVADAMERAGEFACSNPLLNQIYHNIYWGMRGNYRSIPTDCPQRDERQGWLGDRSAESQGETYLFNVAALYGKWLQDINDAQKPSGSVPDVAPTYWSLYNDGVTWPSSFVIIPGHIYNQYADTRILADRYDGMKKWIEYMTKSYMKGDLMPRDTYGDWCVPPESQQLIHSQDPARKTDGTLIGTAYFIHDLRLMAKYANILGKTEDAKQFEQLAERMKAAFNKRFFKPEANLYDNGSQTSYVLPLAMNLVPEERRAQVFANLVKKIESENKGHIGTGLIGAQWLMRVLSDHGRIDIAYEIASQKTYPSWGYMISKGATTIWELWNGDTADPAMNSGNHVMLVGDLATWMHEYLAGIAPDPKQPGFKHIIIRPRPVGDLTYAKASHQTMYGVIRSEWRIEGKKLTLKVSIPPNTTASVYVPSRTGEASPQNIGSGDHVFTVDW